MLWAMLSSFSPPSFICYHLHLTVTQVWAVVHLYCTSHLCNACMDRPVLHAQFIRIRSTKVLCMSPGFFNDVTCTINNTIVLHAHFRRLVWKYICPCLCTAQVFYKCLSPWLPDTMLYLHTQLLPGAKVRPVRESLYTRAFKDYFPIVPKHVYDWRRKGMHACKWLSIVHIIIAIKIQIVGISIFSTPAHAFIQFVLLLHTLSSFIRHWLYWEDFVSPSQSLARSIWQSNWFYVCRWVELPTWISTSSLCTH